MKSAVSKCRAYMGSSCCWNFVGQTTLLLADFKRSNVKKTFWTLNNTNLVGGWTNPFEKICPRQIGSWNPNIQLVNIRNVWVATTQKFCWYNHQFVSSRNSSETKITQLGLSQFFCEKTPTWQFCWWPFWDGDSWPFKGRIVTSKWGIKRSLWNTWYWKSTFVKTSHYQRGILLPQAWRSHADTDFIPPFPSKTAMLSHLSRQKISFVCGLMPQALKQCPGT